MYVNDEEKSKLIWQPSDQPVVLLWESLKSIREQSFNLFLSRNSQMSGVLSISPELQFSEKRIQNILVFLFVFQQFWFQRSLILWSMNQLYPFNFDLRNDWSKAFVFLNTCWGDYLWTIFRTQLEKEQRGIFFLNVKLAFMSLFCPSIPWLLNFFNIISLMSDFSIFLFLILLICGRMVRCVCDQHIRQNMFWHFSHDAKIYHQAL